MWGEALLAATYIYNRTLYKALNYKTPIEELNKLNNNNNNYYNNIKTWGSIVYYKDNSANKSKLDPRVNKGVLIGYGENNNIYKIWDLSNR